MQLTVNSEYIWVSTQPTDFRKAIDGLCALVNDTLERSPMAGVYLFFNRSLDKVKLLSWHRNGFVLIYKRLERGKFHITKTNKHPAIVSIDAKQLSWLLAGLDWPEMSDWNELSFEAFS